MFTTSAVAFLKQKSWRKTRTRQGSFNGTHFGGNETMLVVDLDLFLRKVFLRFVPW